MVIGYRVASDELERIRATWPGIEGEVVASYRGGFALRLRMHYCPDGITIHVGREPGQSLDLFPDPPRPS